MTSLISEAIQWWQAGYTPLPVKPDGSKAPAVKSWTDYQKVRPTLPETLELFKTDSDGIGLICGAVSGGLEMLELEARAVEAGFIDSLEQAFIDHDQRFLWNRIHGYSELTPSGGVHYYYRVDGHSLGNRKLARRLGDDGPEVLVETRGEGGFTVIAPSGGRTHPTGYEWRVQYGRNLADVPVLTTDERDTIHAIASTLDQMPVVEPPPPRSSHLSVAGELRPGDDYNQRATWKEILEPHGWTVHKHYGGNLYGWRKPNKSHPGISATTGRNDADRIFVFSTSTIFEPERPYSKFGAYALLNHGGDYAAAARELRKLGYGATNDPKDVAAPKPPHQPELTALEAFWQARPVLTHIRQFALARMMPPWAVLGNCILRVLTTIPPYVVLPPIIGGYGSLNLFAALVAPSGMGKGGSDRVARDAIHFTTNDPLGMGIYTAPVGSGEGIAHQYAHRDRTGITRDRDAVLFEVPEVDTLTALGGRQGSTLLSQLRLAFSGERLGFGYADAIKRIPIEADTYRLCLSVGVQPERAGPLIWDADGGTPQRFIWLPATDTHIKANRPDEPTPLIIEQQDFPKGFLYDKYHVLSVPDSVTKFVVENQEKRHAGDGNALDAHSVFAREKVAQALTFLDQRRTMTEEDWELAGIIMTMSDITRASVTATLETKQGKVDEARAHRQANRENIIEQSKIEHALQRVTTIICRHANSNGGIAWAELRKSLASRDRDHFDEAIERLVTDGLVEIIDAPKGRLVRTFGPPK